MDSVKAVEMRDSLRMGDITQATGVSDQAVRHYERMGLLRSTGRTSGGFRLFAANTVPRIRLIKDLQGIGFSLGEIRTLINPAQKGDPACREARDFLTRKAEEMEREIQRIRLILSLLIALNDICEKCGGPCTLEDCLIHRLEAAGLPSGTRPA